MANLMSDTRDLIELSGTRYGLAVAVAKRARMLVDGDVPLVEVTSTAEKPVTTAVRELVGRRVIIVDKTE